jgi:hypothetical protein
MPSDNFLFTATDKRNSAYSGSYPSSNLRTAAREIKDYASDLPLALTLGTVAKESTIGKKPNATPYDRWQALPELGARIKAIKHPNYLTQLTNAFDRQIRSEGEESFLSPIVYKSGRGSVKGNNVDIQNRNIAQALTYDPELKSIDLSASIGAAKLREGMQKFNNVEKAAQWYNTKEKDRGARVMSLGNDLLRNPSVRQILVEEGLIK